MGNLFFPGATRYGRWNNRNRCLWREEEFLFILLKQAILPRLGLRENLESWSKISLCLRENSRKRELQIAKLEKEIPFLS